MKNLLLFPILLLTAAAWGAVHPVTKTSRSTRQHPSDRAAVASSSTTSTATSTPTSTAGSAGDTATSTPTIVPTSTPTIAPTSTPTIAPTSAAGSTGETTTSIATSTPPSTTTSTATITPTSTAGSAGDTIAAASGGQTWYVNGGGGTRYSSNQPAGQCNGTSSAAYPGSGVNQNCAFKDIRSLWTDGSNPGDPKAGAPGWGWIGSSGDTYLIDCNG